MTCTECKYQWCWLCEGEYQLGHFDRGQCLGLQYSTNNYVTQEYQNKEEDGCILHLHRSGSIILFHGKKWLSYFISLLGFFFLTTIFFSPLALDGCLKVLRYKSFHCCYILLLVFYCIAYQLLATSLVIPIFFISSLIPRRKINMAFILFDIINENITN